MNQKNQLRKNPSRETCESIIRRILMTELTQNGKNRHFRKAADFMSYFESLYPASNALTKQVQRAVQSLHMPKDADGFLLWTRQLHRWNRNNALRNYLQMQMSPSIQWNR